MLSKLATAGAVAAVIVGAGTTALAVSGEPATTAGHAALSNTAKKHHSEHARRGGLRKVLARVAHAEVITKGKDGFVEHDAIRGQVTAVSASSISVKAADGFSASFVIDKTTHVRKRDTDKAKPKPGGSGPKQKAAPARITDVKPGDQVVVLGKQAASASGAPIATVVIDGVRTK
jgi:hypothetical protein